MRISKLLSAVCAAAFLAGSLAVRAQDTPAQAAARAALMDKMSELDAQQSQPTNSTPILPPPSAPTPAETQPAPAVTAVPETAPPPAAAAEPVQTPEPAAAPVPPPVIVVTASGAGQEQAAQPTNAAPQVEPTSKTADDDVVMTPVNAPVSKADKAAAKAKAKQEADQAAADLKAKKEADRKAAEQMAADKAAAKAQAKAKAKADAQQAAAELKASKEAEAAAKAQAAAQPAAPAPNNSGFFTPVPPPSNPEIQAGAQPALQQKMSESNQQPVATPPPAKPAVPEAAPAVKPPPANASYAGKTLGFKPIEAPVPPVSAQKVAELQALLARYMANQISPDEYQKARAAILAEP
jgi:hypothetical protein